MELDVQMCSPFALWSSWRKFLNFLINTYWQINLFGWYYLTSTDDNSCEDSQSIFLINRSAVAVFNTKIEMLTYLLTYLLTHFLTYSLTYLFTYLFAYLFKCLVLTYLLTYLLVYLLAHLLSYSLTHLLTYLLIHLHIYLPTYLHIYLLTYLLTYLLCPLYLCIISMAKVLEALISKGRRVRRAVEQREAAFGLADLSTHGTG